MGKVEKLIKALGLLVRKPYLLNKVIDDNEAWKERVEKEYGFMGGFDEISFHELADGKEIVVNPFAFLEGGSLPTDLALLRILAGRFEKCSYFEIGTWRGESVANVAEVAEECTTMNLSEADMRSAGLAEEYIQQHAMFSKALPNVLHLDGNSINFDFTSMDKKYDLVFIDGDHHFDSIRSDTQNVFSHLVHENSIVVWHDYAWQPGNVRYETMAAILAGTPEQYRKRLFCVRNTLCAIYFPGEIDFRKATTIARKEEAYTIRINKA